MADTKFIKYLIIVAVVLAALLATGIAAFLFMQIQQEKKQILYLKQEIERISKDKTSILEKIEAIKKDKDAVNSQLNEQSEKLRLIQEDISSAKGKRDEIIRQLSEKEKLARDLKNRLNSAIKQESELNAQLENARSAYQKALEKINSTQEEKKKLEEEIKSHLSSTEGVELKKIVVKVGPAVEGKVVEVNDKYNFSIINLGINNDIKSGELVGIYRSDKLIAKAIVENVYEDMSSIIVLDDFTGVRLLTGDTVKLLKS